MENEFARHPEIPENGERTVQFVEEIPSNLPEEIESFTQDLEKKEALSKSRLQEILQKGFELGEASYDAARNEAIAKSGYNPASADMEAMFIDRHKKWNTRNPAKDEFNRLWRQSAQFSKWESITAFLERIVYAGQEESETTQEEFYTKLFGVFVKLAPEYPHCAFDFWIAFSPHAEHIDPETFIDGLAELAWRPELRSGLSGKLLKDISFLYDSNPEAYSKAIQKNLDFEHEENYFRSATFLEFIKGVYDFERAYGDFSRMDADTLQKGMDAGRFTFYDENGNPMSAEEMASLSYEDSMKGIKERLKEAAEKEKGSYLLKLRANQIVKGMETGDYGAEDTKPFLLAKDVYVFCVRGILYRVAPENNKKCEMLLSELEENQQTRALQIKKNNIFEDKADKELDERIAEIQMRLGSLLTQEMNVDDFTIARRDKTPEEIKHGKQDMFDYEYLTRKPVREMIEREFHFNLADLSLQEQFYFLQFIKSKEASEVEPVQSFVDRYGVAGLKTFLSLDYGQEMGDKILELGNELKEEDAKELFGEYSKIVDNAREIKEQMAISETFANLQMATELKKDFWPNLYEAIVRRTKDLLYAAHAIGVDGEKDSQMSIQNVKDALYGLRTFFEIFKNLQTHEDYEVELQSENDLEFQFRVVDKRERFAYGFRVFIRPEEEIREGKTAQARINFELRFSGARKNAREKVNTRLREAFFQGVHYPQKSGKRFPFSRIDSALRVGIDRDVRGGREFVSLDLGRNRLEPDRAGNNTSDFYRTGDVLGNSLQLVSRAGHHTMESFDSRYADPEIFRTIAIGFKDYMREKSREIKSIPGNSKLD